MAIPTKPIFEHDNHRKQSQNKDQSDVDRDRVDGANELPEDNHGRERMSLSVQDEGNGDVASTGANGFDQSEAKAQNHASQRLSKASHTSTNNNEIIDTSAASTINSREQLKGIAADCISHPNGTTSVAPSSSFPALPQSPTLLRPPPFPNALSEHQQHQSVQQHRKVRKRRASSLRKAALILGSRERERERSRAATTAAAAAAAAAHTWNCDRENAHELLDDEGGVQWRSPLPQQSSAVAGTGAGAEMEEQPRLLFPNTRGSDENGLRYGKRSRGYSTGSPQQSGRPFSMPPTAMGLTATATPPSFFFSTPPTITPPQGSSSGSSGFDFSGHRYRLRSHSETPPFHGDVHGRLARSSLNQQQSHPSNTLADKSHKSAPCSPDSFDLDPFCQTGINQEPMPYIKRPYDHEHLHQNHYHQRHILTEKHHPAGQQENMLPVSANATLFPRNAKSPLSDQLVKNSSEQPALPGKVNSQVTLPPPSKPSSMRRDLHATSFAVKQHPSITATNKLRSSLTSTSAETSHPTSPLALSATTASAIPAAGAALGDPTDDPWDYTETERWGWFILIVTWIVFVIGMGSCFGVWSWAWDVGETPYAPPELEDDPTLPIVGYYPALIILTAVMAWVWVVVAWVGMKYFRHANIVGEEL